MDSAAAASASSSATQPAQASDALTQIPLHPTDNVAPPQLFASPFLPEHERAIVAILHADHPTLTLARATVTILQRLSDRLAHYLIDRAYRGLNSGMQDRLDVLLCGTEEAAGLSASSPSAPGDRHALLFTFDEPTWSSLGSLRKFAHSAGIKAQTKLEEQGPNGFEALAGNTKSCMLSLAHADRWLNDFTAGLRLTDETATLPASLHSTDQRAVLCATVEYLLEELLELTGNETKDQCETIVQPAHLATATDADAELQALCAFLPVDWAIQMEGIASPLQLACASQPLDAVRHRMRILQFAMSSHTAAQTELNRSSWYQDSAAVIGTARLAARGQLPESPLSRQLRAAHVRPVRFWGVSDSIDSSLRRACVIACGFEYQQLYEFDREHAFVSFELTDAMDRVFQMLLVGERDGSPRGLCFVSLPGSSFALCLAAFLGVGDDQQVRWSAATGTRGDDAPTAMDEYRARGGRENSSELSAAQASAAQQASVCVASSDASSAASSSSSADAPALATAIASSAIVAESDRLPASTRAEIECACRSATSLLKFSLVGPSIFAENHPPSMRRLFTAHLLDQSMVAAGLSPLPLVLSELIADYHSFDLPFREDAAAEQMSQAGFNPRKQEPLKATYEGQLDSAVERVLDASD